MPRAVHEEHDTGLAPASIHLIPAELGATEALPEPGQVPALRSRVTGPDTSAAALQSHGQRDFRGGRENTYRGQRLHGVPQERQGRVGRVDDLNAKPRCEREEAPPLLVPSALPGLLLRDLSSLSLSLCRCIQEGPSSARQHVRLKPLRPLHEKETASRPLRSRQCRHMPGTHLCLSLSRTTHTTQTRNLDYYSSLTNQGFKLSCYNKETILFTIDPYYGNLN